MTVIVTDTSAIVELLRQAGTGDRIAQRMHGSTAIAPAHLDADVLSALGRLERGGFVSDHAVKNAISYLERLPVERIPIRPLLDRAWQLRQTLALRDGLYVACAERFEARLLTLDARLARSCPEVAELNTDPR